MSSTAKLSTTRFSTFFTCASVTSHQENKYFWFCSKTVLRQLVRVTIDRSIDRKIALLVQMMEHSGVKLGRIVENRKLIYLM